MSHNEPLPSGLPFDVHGDAFSAYGNYMREDGSEESKDRRIEYLEHLRGSERKFYQDLLAEEEKCRKIFQILFFISVLMNVFLFF